MKKLTLLAILATATLVACDTETEGPAPNTKTQLLTADPWRMTSWTSTTGSGSPVDQMPAQACQRDDRYSFGTNGVMTRTEGPLPCSGNSQTVVLTAPWNFNSGQTILTIGAANMGASTIPYEVVRLTADEMQLRYSRSVNMQTVVDNVNYVN
ncbi:hypothetical protein GCM10023185_11940 [Hymenobacter saemangeumensis]|uniref:Lipocalin-like domain-containing protein n=1 Tax=Hymenobacter saemangeumensis TaxID=1084522 RepID=A0ABP8I6X9_9BACT